MNSSSIVIVGGGAVCVCVCERIVVLLPMTTKPNLFDDFAGFSFGDTMRNCRVQPRIATEYSMSTWSQ